VENFIQLTLLGIIEGITEFLPISSTAHLLIVQHWIGSRSEAFNIVIQSGAIFAALLIYWRKFLSLILEFHKPEILQHNLKLITAFLLTCILGFIIKKLGWTLPETLTPVILSLIAGSFIILYVERRYPKVQDKISDHISWHTVFIVALAQILAAIFPGLSRSGAVIMFAMLFYTSRPAATEFSFLVGIPTMFAASTLSYISETKNLTQPPKEPLFDIAIAFTISTIVAFIVVRWLLRYVQTHTLIPFAYYRLLLAFTLLLLQ
jgi:undecaprenyl-diphosphatase